MSDGQDSACSSVCLISGAHPTTSGTGLSGAPPASPGELDVAGVSGGTPAAPMATSPRCREIREVSWDQPLDDVVVTCTEYMSHEGCIPHASASIVARHREVMLRHQNVVDCLGSPTSGLLCVVTSFGCTRPHVLTRTHRPGTYSGLLPKLLQEA